MMTGGDDVAETELFVEMFDKLFDCLNVSNFNARKRQRKAFKQPYRSAKDFRLKVISPTHHPSPNNQVAYNFKLQWLLDEFLPYLDSWEKSVAEREGFTDVEKNKMLLSQPTLDGLRMTGRYIVKLLLHYNA